MFNSKERKEERLNRREHDEITASKYNLTIGLCIIYGFVMTAILTAIARPIVEEMNYVVFLLLYFGCAIAGSIISTKSHDPKISFLGYNLIVLPIGALLSICLPAYDPALIMSAFLTTAAVTGIMMFIATSSFGHIFERMGPALFLSLTIGIIAELVTGLFGYGGDLFNWFFVVIFSLYIGYDWHKAQMYPKTIDNAVDSAIDLYLDIINLFMRILEILGRSKSRK